MATNKKETVQNSNVNPLLANAVKERPYAKLNVNLSEEDYTNPLPEPTNDMEAVDDEFVMDIPGNSPSKAEQAKMQQEQEQPFNPSFTQMPKSDQRQASANLAKMSVFGYKQLIAFGDDFMKISKRKMLRWQEKGYINLNARVPYGDEGQLIKVIEVFEQYNATVEHEPLSPEVEAEMIELLTEIYAKNGVGLTPEQRLIQLILTDLVMRSRKIYNSIRTQNAILDNLKQGFAAYKQQAPVQNNATNVQEPVTQEPPPANYSQPPSNQQTETITPIEIIGSDDDTIEPIVIPAD